MQDHVKRCLFQGILFFSFCLSILKKCCVGKVRLCEACLTWYDSKKDLTLHKNLHKKTVNKLPCCVRCLQCQKTFKTQRLLTYHVQKVHEKRFQCSNCLKKFGTMFDLNIHARVHRQEKPLACHFFFFCFFFYCFSSYKKKGNLACIVIWENTFERKRKIEAGTIVVFSSFLKLQNQIFEFDLFSFKKSSNKKYLEIKIINIKGKKQLFRYDQLCKDKRKNTVIATRQLGSGLKTKLIPNELKLRFLLEEIDSNKKPVWCHKQGKYNKQQNKKYQFQNCGKVIFQ
ncbi:hypothetical protein RFI_07416 [Reticulomyxa filosa]|uniref:C2H2-type domain-containing protein n=1 Tax=Reticulomyxa filosa TaxID=46433 RepID=X6NWN5_RETFI|nr:hypothetical protein RFI_07416 [Reticulomyxa filosa]|eukprot:ETO29702.1 hypothetical protein RFI_07416 [Reticulomyxa filosa]